ncbi:hypothetical protein Tco_0551654 [Tanacetum coccineum]
MTGVDWPLTDIDQTLTCNVSNDEAVGPYTPRGTTQVVTRGTTNDYSVRCHCSSPPEASTRFQRNVSLRIQKSIHPLSSSPTPSFDPVVEPLSPSLTPFGKSDLLLEETNAFVSLDDSIPPSIDNVIYDSEGDILFLEELLNDDPTTDLPPPIPVFEINETEKIKTSIENPPNLDLKDLPPHLEYVFLEGTSKLPVITAKDVKGRKVTAS